MPRCFSMSIQSLVAWRSALRAFTRAGLTDRPAVEQQLFGQGGFTCVRVADNGEGAPFQDLLHCFGSQCFGSHEGLFPLFLA